MTDTHTDPHTDPLSETASQMPGVSEHAIQAEEEDRQLREAENADLTDKDGNPFDPSIHRTDSNGEPIVTSAGNLQKKPGRKKGSPGNNKTSGAKSRGGGAQQSRLHIPGMESQESASADTGGLTGGDPRMTGYMIAEQIFSVGQLIGGQEWAPFEMLNPDAAKQYGIAERHNMRETWAVYCEQKGIRDIPPGIAVTMVMMQYAGLRMAMPQTQSRLQRVKSWLYSKYASYKAKRSGRNARSNSGHDAERQNESRETTRE